MNAAAFAALTLCVCATLTACAGTGAHAKTPADLSPASLYPLGEGFAWSYDVDTGDQQPTLAVMRVVGVQGASVEISSGAPTPIRYLVRNDGVEKALGGYLLKAPIAEGTTWASGIDTTARVAALHVKLASPAGSFDECVVVEEHNATSGQRVTTTYCPGVGPAQVVSEMEVRGKTLTVTARLRGYTVTASTTP